MQDADDTTAARFARVDSTFRQVIDGVDPDGWDRPSPSAGWTARDVVDHLVTWVPGVFERAGVDLATPDDESPGARWAALGDSLQRALDDPALAGRTFDAGPPGELTVGAAVAMLVTGDVLVHSWDLAAATGQQVQLDPAAVHELLVGMQQMGDMLVQSGHFGAPVQVPDDADEATRLLAFSGRDVLAWS